MTTATRTRRSKADEAEVPAEGQAVADISSATAPEPDPAAAWLSEANSLLGDLQGGTLRKLAALAENPPAGAAVFAPLRAILLRTDSINTLNPALGAGKYAAVRAPDRDAIESGVRAFVGSLMASADRAMDAGLHDEADPVLRPADFGDRLFTGTVQPFAESLAIGLHDALPEGHPARAVEPLELDGGRRVILLGRAGGKHYRLSVAKDMTAKAVEYRREELDRARQAEERRRAEVEAAWRNSPEGLRSRIAELERKLAEAGVPAA